MFGFDGKYSIARERSWMWWHLCDELFIEFFLFAEIQIHHFIILSFIRQVNFTIVNVATITAIRNFTTISGCSRRSNMISFCNETKRWSYQFHEFCVHSSLLLRPFCFERLHCTTTKKMRRKLFLPFFRNRNCIFFLSEVEYGQLASTYGYTECRVLVIYCQSIFSEAVAVCD